jgi:hypothetical protein
MTEMHDREIE